MAAFRLLKPHQLQMMTPQGLQHCYLEAGASIDSASMPAGWTPTIWMEGLDDAARALIDAETARLEEEFAKGPQGYGELPGAGPRSTWPRYPHPEPHDR